MVNAFIEADKEPKQDCLRQHCPIGYSVKSNHQQTTGLQYPLNQPKAKFYALYLPPYLAKEYEKHT